MLVPMPWLTRPPHLFSRKEATANPTMCAQHPAHAAAAANRLAPNSESGILLNSITPNAALDVGKVSNSPITAAMRMPNVIGSHAMAWLIPRPNNANSMPNGMPSTIAAAAPDAMATMGITMMSTGVLPSMREHNSIATTAAAYAATGSPIPILLPVAPHTFMPLIIKILVMFAPNMPAAAAENIVSLGDLNAWAIPTPMPAPIIMRTAVPIYKITLPTL